VWVAEISIREVGMPVVREAISLGAIQQLARHHAAIHHNDREPGLTVV
jgi:hypothetical protein